MKAFVISVLFYDVLINIKSLEHTILMYMIINKIHICIFFFFFFLMRYSNSRMHIKNNLYENFTLLININQ